MADAKIPANKIIPIFAVVTAETTLWTPAAGKRFRLLGYSLSSATTASAITLRDNTAGPTFMFIPNQALGVPVTSPDLGNGYLSLTANNVLTALGGAGQILSGFLFGTEE